jgi:predicted HD superfamily hydrolase involved in NAD metabolism
MGPIRAQITAVRKEMSSRPKGLQAHVERVVEESLDLADRYDVDPERVELAARGHDLFRSNPPPERLRLAREAGIPITSDDEAAPVMLHGPLGAAVMASRFGIDDDEVLAAVRDHTAGFAQMSLIAKIILLADKFEPRKRKRTPVMAGIRRLARRDLDTALLCWADWKWVEERERGYASYPAHWTARRRWVAEHHEDIALPRRVREEEWASLRE